MASSTPSEPALRREMGLRDVALLAIACMTASRWIPAAAHAGPGSVPLWILGALFFVIPMAVTLSALVVKNPCAGGFYQWTRDDFGPWHGFLCFWVYWMGLAFWFPTASMFYMRMGLYALGPEFAKIGDNRAALLTIALAAIWIALISNMVGVRVGKWTENIGGGANWILVGLLVATAFLVWRVRGGATPLHILPKWDWGTVNLWAAIAYGLSGLEMASLMGAEIHDPKRNLPRAGWIASIFLCLFYVAGTVAMLVILKPDKISEMTGVAEVGDSAGLLLHAAWLSPLLALLVLASGVGQIGGIGTTISRLPFAAGVDRLLPNAFARVHPRWGTPHLSILALGIVASFLLLVFQVGDSMRAAYDSLVSIMVITGFLPYIYIFGSGWKAKRRISAICGWGITLMAIVCAVVPTEAVSNLWVFEGKLAAGTLAVIGTAWLVYRRSARGVSGKTIIG